MALQEFEPNDIVIHLVNPYKCGDCGSEFCVRSLFIEHFNEHIEKLKSESPCHQIICSTSLVEHQLNGITVTRDILQINEQQMFELQDPSLDYTQLTPLKTLEQAGILNLPPPRQIHRSPVKREAPIILTVQEGDIITEGKKISLLGGQRITSQEVNPLHIQMVGDLGAKYNEPQVCVQQVIEGGNVSFDLDAIMQQALVDKIKEEFSSTIDESAQNDANSLSVEGNIPTNYSMKKAVTCPVCFIVFANASALERHQVVHQGVKPYPCLKCFKQFNDVSSMRKHMLIHKRQHRCPICHRMFLQRSQLSVHMRQHSKQRFIQFGNSFHEVRVVVTRNETGQQVQEYSLLALMTEEQLKKVHMTATAESADTAETSSNNTVTAELKKSDNTAVALLEGNEVDNTQSQGCNELKKKIVYRCGHCEKLIFSRPTLSRHLVKHTNTRPFQCEVCSKAFRDKADLFHHNKTHTKPVQCSTCGTQFSKALYLHNHMLKGCPVSNSDDRFTVLENLKCQCNVCKKVLKNKANMIRHLKVHAFQDAQKRIKNNVVEKNEEFTETLSESVEDHYRGIENSVGFSCLICGQEFRFKSFMITHVRMHLNLRPYKCEQCSKRFFAQHMLKKHIQNHTRPYKCPVCAKGFIRRYLMKDHYKKRHEDNQEDVMRDITELVDEKKIQCDICGKTMKSYQKSLMLHHIRQHKDFRPFVCQTCQKTFTSDTALKKHLLNHSKPYVCQVCKHGFSRRYLLTDHFRKKCGRIKGGDKVKIVVKSMQSSKSEGEADKLTNNLVDVDSGELPSESLAEGESFEAQLITDVNPNTGATTYACEPCNKKFTLYEALLRHVNTFAKPTPCKYCKTVFKDKHLTICHQRSCLGTPIDTVVKTEIKADSKVIGEQQEKVQKIMKVISEKIEEISSSPNTKQDDRIPSTSQHSESSDVIPEKGFEKEVQMSTLTKTLQALKEDSGKYRCPECKRSFTSIRGMKIHASSHVRLFKCEVCGKDFTHIAHLRTHVHTHKEVPEDATEVEEVEKQSSAEITKEEVTNDEGQAENNKKHDLTMTPKPQILKKRKLEVDSDGDDDKSDIKFTTKDILDVTQRLMGTGTRGRPFSCKMCRRRFTESAGLKSHMLQIHGIKM